ncbi:MAG TPA: hypothetical protein VJ691_14005 [Vicinamibacterales bacterium]|nr:hypothetical protein [Vicinamibacterales bacterium]
MIPGSSRIGASAAASATPRTSLSPASTVTLSGQVDSNSPVIWNLEDGQQRLFVMTSFDGIPRIATGTSIDRLGAAADVTLQPHPGYGVWMEAIVFDDVETWYGYYHNEWPALRCGREDRMVSRIGAAKSTDNGRTWQDLGPVIQSPQSATACQSNNRYIIGGVGDLSVMLDENKQYLYFFYSQYQERREGQGVAVARMVWADRDWPAGRIALWRDGIWDGDARRRELQQTIPGSMRRRLEWTYPAATPLVMPTYAWHDADDRVDAFWGPSVHWNTALQQYVMLLNRSKDEGYAQEGIYVSYAPRLDDPSLWTAPVKILHGGKWYPQVVGSGTGIGTDKQAGSSARFFMGGRSDWIISFSQ